MSFYFPLPEKVTKSKIVYDCERCGLYKNEKLNKPKFETIIGENYNGLVIVADTPSREDDIKGLALINERASVLRASAFKNKVNLLKEAAIIFAHRCYKRNPTDSEFKCCQSLLENDLKELKPKLIVTLGEMAFKSVMNLKNKIGHTKIRNRVIPCYEHNALIYTMFDPNNVFTYHTKFALQKDMERCWQLWKNQFHKRTVVNEILEERKILEGIRIEEIKTPAQLKDEFENYLLLQKRLALDYETTNLNPYDDFFEIITIQISTEDKVAYVIHEDFWINNPENWKLICNYMILLLTNPNILKVIQNAKFEDLCSRYVFNIPYIVNTFCTMLATHVIDERKGVTSLDFQNLVRFGIPPYDDAVKQYKELKTKDNITNSLRQAAREELIKYGGLDVITAFANFKILDKVLLPNSYPLARQNYEFLHEGHWTFANMTQRGIPISGKAYEEVYTLLNDKLSEIIEQIISDPMVQQYNEYLKQKSVKENKPKTKLTDENDIVLEELIFKIKSKRKLTFE